MEHKLLFIRFFVHKDSVPYDSWPVTEGRYVHVDNLKEAEINTHIANWMTAHPDGKVDFIYI